MKKFTIIVIILILFGLSLPISNLIIGPPGDVTLAEGSDDDGLLKIAAVLEKKCVNCHTQKGQIPFYARFPIARTIIAKDISMGTEFLDMLEAFQEAKDGAHSEVLLAKIEYTTMKNSMPPVRYIALHWDSYLSPGEKEMLLSWIIETRKKNYATKGIPEEIQAGVLQPLPQKVKLNPKKVELGDKLYHDTRLSGDNTISCASCHDLNTKGGTDQLQFSKGIGGAVGDINAPTTFNSAYQFKQFWDGRAADLEEQADGPVNNPIEMGSNWPQVIAKLSEDEAFVTAFTEAYPKGLKSETIRNAIAEFERSLNTLSRFDRYLLGDASALTEKEIEGYHLFVDHGCAMCHVGVIMGGQSFEKMGRYADYFVKRGHVHKPDYGRFNVTQDEKDRFRLKVPTLRNIALTGPYFHDGETKELKEAIRIMSEVEVKDRLTETEIDRVEMFLMTLTGQYKGKALQ